MAPTLIRESYLLQKGLLYHQSEGGVTEQHVVPQSLREKVLMLGHHSIPWARHLCSVKTLDHIASKYFWPGLYTDVQNFCKICPECQLASHKKVQQVPLQPMPIIDVPFSRIGMDIVEPLDTSRSGYRSVILEIRDKTGFDFLKENLDYFQNLCIYVY